MKLKLISKQALRLWLLSLVCVGAVHAAEVVDDRGQTVRFDKPAARVVSLLPSLTEVVCALGACDRLVAVDRYSVWPEQVKRLPTVGGGLDPHIEAIVALRPDVVLVSDASRVTDRLAALGIKVVALQTQTHADVRRVLGRVGAILGVPERESEAVWQRVQQDIRTAAKKISPAARGARVFVEVSRGPFAAGESSFIGETLAALGMQNVVTKAQGPFPKLNPEFVVRADPDLIMSTSRGEQNLATYPGWSRMRAVQRERVCHFNAEESDLLIHPGPRMAEGAEVMVRCINAKWGKAAAGPYKQGR
ncbi:MAG: helical backbone metal receptor [Brachymonas sp.]|nr:helical backbone metal receptor [Brachymonas sp.]